MNGEIHRTSDAAAPRCITITGREKRIRAYWIGQIGRADVGCTRQTGYISQGSVRRSMKAAYARSGGGSGGAAVRARKALGDSPVNCLNTRLK